MRDWSYLGWITWKNILSVEVASDHALLRHSVVVQLTDEELSRLSIIDRVKRMLVSGLVRVIQSNDDGQKTLLIASDAELKCSQADFKTAINRVLSNADVPCTWKQRFE